MKKTLQSALLITAGALLAGCPNQSNEGYLLTYLDQSKQVHVRFSASGAARSWQTGTFPVSATEQSAGLGASADNSGNVYLVAANLRPGVAVWNGVGANTWQDVSPDRNSNNVPSSDSVPAVAFAAPGLWFIAFNSSQNNLELHLYNPAAQTLAPGNLASSVPASGILGAPAVTSDRQGQHVVLSWFNDAGISVAVATIGQGGQPANFTVTTPIPSGSSTPLPAPRSAPFLTTGEAGAFYLGYVGATLLPSVGSPRETQRVVILRSTDLVTWSLYGTEANAANAGLTLRGIAGRSDGSVLVAKLSTASGFVLSRCSRSDPSSSTCSTWSGEDRSAFDATPFNAPFSLTRTGSPSS
jgi:hypothetical protein